MKKCPRCSYYTVSDAAREVALLPDTMWLAGAILRCRRCNRYYEANFESSTISELGTCACSGEFMPLLAAN